MAERPRDAAIHVVDGEVHSIAQVGSTVVMGGTFTKVGPVTRGAVGIVDTSASTFGSAFPDVVGTVNDIVSDGAGGWYVGGQFTSVGGQARTNFAHVDAAGEVTAFAPNPNGAVNALVANPAGGVYVAGDFTTFDATTANRLVSVAVDDTVAWIGNVSNGSNTVKAIALSQDASTLYVGGNFSRIDGVTVNRFGAVSAATGARLGSFSPGTVNNTVRDVVVNGGDVVLAGDFTSVGGSTRNRLAVVNGTSGALQSLNVSINNTVADIEVDAASNTAYLAGSFGTVGGSTRARLAAVNLGTGAVGSLAITNITGNLNAVTLDGAGSVYIGGPMQITPEKDNPANLAKVNLATNAISRVVPYYETPRSLARTPIGGSSGPNALLMAGGSLVVAGNFSDYGMRTQNYLLAYDLATGALKTDFQPNPNGAVYSVKSTPDGTQVYAGGEFTTISGNSASRIAKLEISDGTQVGGFSASANSYVKDMAVRADGTAVYVGGNFDQFNGAQVSRFTAIDPATGDRISGFDMNLTEPTNDFSEGGLRAMALAPDGNTLMVIGNFKKIAGETRPLIAQIDVSSSPATVTSWHTDLYNQPCARSGKVGFMRDVDIAPDGQTLYVVSAGHFYYPACDTANAFPMASAGNDDVQPIWSKKIGDTQEAVAASEDTVYISGHFRYLETETKSEPRFQIAAVDAATGEGLNWIPNAGGFRGVLTLELEPAGLFAGSDGDAFGGVNHGRNAFWPAPSAGIEVRKAGDRRWILAPSGQVTWTFTVLNTYSDKDVQLNSLSDSVLGNLDGAGTCSLPQSIPVGGSYSCSAPQTVTGSAGTQVNSGTVTASATPDGGGTATDTDTALVDVFSSAPVFRTRLVLGPGQVQFPGATIRFSATLMNLDPLRSATLTSLTSPLFGDLSAQCGLPRPIGPNQLHYCHLDLPVEGSVGSRTTYTFTGSASYDTGTLTSSSGQTVTITPPVGGSKILVVVADPNALGASDVKLRDRLSSSYALTFVDDNTAAPADVTPDYSMVIIGPSAVEARLGNRLAGVDTPTLVTHARMLDEMGMSAPAPAGNGSVNGTTWDITGWMHPLSTARSGVQTINTSSLAITWGAPEASADVISQLSAGQATEFVYTTGDTMTTGTAPACRVFFASGNNTRFGTTAWALFDRAVAYTSMGCGKNMLWTAAGNGSSSYGSGGDGRASVAVGFSTPWGIAVDSQNRLFVADAGTHSVRRIDPDGRVYTVAGTGTSGSTGDGGQATSARLNTPVRLAFDPSGNLFIADSGNNKIRKVTMSTGVITTVAGTGTAGNTGDGGQATSARLRTPYDVTFAPDGTMYIADRGNHKIRRVTTAGVISTFAGNGSQGYNGDQISATSARLNNPYSVALDAAGNLYIADYDNERVRIVSNGIIDTFAGTGVATADGDGGPANEAGLHKPQYIQILANGDMLISESNNNDIRIVHDGLIDLLAGSRQFGYSGDGGSPLFSTWSRPSSTVVDAAGNIWVVDRGNRRIRVIQSSN